MKSIISMTVLALSLAVPSAFASYDCFKLQDDDGNLGEKVVTIDKLSMDPKDLIDLKESLKFEGKTLIKYQYWLDAGNSYHMVHFVGIADEVDEIGAPQMTALNLFCKAND